MEAQFEALSELVKNGQKLNFGQDFFVKFYQAFLYSDRWQQYIKGVGTTLLVTAIALVLGVVLGAIVAMVRVGYAQQKPHHRNPILGIFNAAAQVYVTVIRGTPMMVQLLIMSMVIFASSRNFTMVGALALGINSGAYVSEIIRGGLMAVDPGQMEAGRSLGLNYMTTMVVIIIPQAIRAVLPALGNEFIVLLKDTSLITVIGGKELLYAAQGIMNRTYEAMFPLLGVALIYLVLVMLFTNSYKKIERAIIAFVSVIGLSFIYELFLVKIDWPQAVQGWVTPSFPDRSMIIVMSVLGAVVMPHNLFLHSEVIQSHEYNKQDDASIRKVLKYELFDTLFSMIVGWAINSAMILLAASTFYQAGVQVEELQQAKSLLEPLLGNNAAVVFALALLMAGISSTITSGMAAGSIFAGIFGESYHIKDSHSQIGVVLSLGIALLMIFFIGDPFKGLLVSQMVLSIQLPFTVFLQVGLTSSRKVMGQYANSRWNALVLYAIAVAVTVLNLMLLWEVIAG